MRIKASMSRTFQYDKNASLSCICGKLELTAQDNDPLDPN